MAFGDDDDLPNEAVQIRRADHSKQSIGSPNVTKTSLASIESLTMPLMQEVVLSADIRCAECQKRVADVMSRMTANADGANSLGRNCFNLYSLVSDSKLLRRPLNLQKSSAQSTARTWKHHDPVWSSAIVRIYLLVFPFASMDPDGPGPETESVVVNVLEKKVTLSCKYPNNQNGVKVLGRPQVPVVYRNPLRLHKVATIKRLFRLSSS